MRMWERIRHVMGTSWMCLSCWDLRRVIKQSVAIAEVCIDRFLDCHPWCLSVQQS